MVSDGTWELPGITHWDGCGEMNTPDHAGCPAKGALSDADTDFGMERQLDATRAILTDLITELRSQHTRLGNRVADRYELRLREVTSDE